jgi:hypothetical protein
MARLFISQDQMDRWTSDGKVSLDDDLMHLPGLGRAFKIRSAVHILKMVEGEDLLGLIGKVKSDEQLAGLQAEHYGASLIVGEAAYECAEGFLGVPAELAAEADSGLLRLG